MSPEEIVRLISGARINTSTETLAQQGLGRLFEQAGLSARPEVRLSSTDRIDFMIGDIGIEVKIGHPRRAILRQLTRYAKSDEVKALILVTSVAFPSGEATLEGKEFHVASLSWGWL